MPRFAALYVSVVAVLVSVMVAARSAHQTAASACQWESPTGFYDFTPLVGQLLSWTNVTTDGEYFLSGQRRERLAAAGWRICTNSLAPLECLHL